MGICKYYLSFNTFDIDVNEEDRLYKLSLKSFINGVSSSISIYIDKDDYDLINDFIDDYREKVKEILKNGK